MLTFFLSLASMNRHNYNYICSVGAVSICCQVTICNQPLICDSNQSKERERQNKNVCMGSLWPDSSFHKKLLWLWTSLNLKEFFGCG